MLGLSREGGGPDRGFAGSGRRRRWRDRPPSSPLLPQALHGVPQHQDLLYKHLGDRPDEVQLLSHGQRVLEAVGVAVRHMDNLRAVLSPLADLHAHVLRVDPTNFPVSHPGT